jgi:hypothetical protein
MLGEVGMFSNPVISWRILQVMRNHHSILRAQPEINTLRVSGLSGSDSNAMNVNMGAVMICPNKNSNERKNSMVRCFLK